jgi:MFS family permease
LLHIINVWEVLVLFAMQGIINAFDTPGRQSFVVQMVEDKEDLSNAIALNASMVTLARLIGPSVAAVLIGAVGEGYCFLVDGFSYMAVIGSLLAMTLRGRVVVSRRQGTLTELAEGWNYVRRSVPIRSVLLLAALVSLMGMPYVVLMPIFAGKILKGGPHTLGFLMSAAALGAMIATVALALRKSVRGLSRVIPAAAVIFGASLIVFANLRYLWLSLLFLFGVGFGIMTQQASSNTILQTIVEDEKRGRVMAYYTMAFMGMAPFGSLMAGALAARFGAPATLTLSGVCCVIGALWFASHLEEIRRIVRPIYIEMGIIPEVAVAIEEVTTLPTPTED